MLSPIALAALLGWIPFVLILFAILPHRQAVTIAVIGAWLILPPYNVQISGLPDYGKNMAATLGIVLGTLILAPNRLLSFRPRWFDVPMILWCLTGIASSLYNGLGIYDGLSDTLGQTLTWGLPYLFGRIYFGTPEDLRYFAAGMVIGGLAYVLPCIWESRMSPQLLQQVYGHSQWMGMRLGGYRPHVFFWTGLECGLWMTAATMSGWWLWFRGGLARIGPIPFGPVLLPLLLGTALLCRSTGALGLLLGGVMLLWLSARFRTRWLLTGLLLVAPLYAGVRLTKLWTGQQAVDLAKAVVGADRAQSLEYRFMCENMLSGRALQQPMFGWGGWGRSLVFFDAESKQMVPTDGLWIIILGTKGFVGLGLFYVAFVLPAFLFVRRFPARSWGDPRLVAGSLAAGLLAVYMVDCLLNGFINIIYITLAGGLSGLEPKHLGTIPAAGRGIEAAGRRPVVGALRAAAAGIGTAGARAGRITLADRCRTLGRSFKQEGRPHEAAAAWQQALDLLGALLEADPGSDDLRRRWCDCANDLSWLWANHPDPSRRDPAAAVSMARRAVGECPDAPAYWNTLGVAHYRAGDHHAAVASLDRARALGGGTAFDHIFLAMAHARLGDTTEARQSLARAMLQAERDHPGHPELAAFCDEARSILVGDAGAPLAVR